jgi:hypothetical protein
VLCTDNTWGSMKQNRVQSSGNSVHLSHHMEYISLFGHNQATYISCITAALASVYIFYLCSCDFFSHITHMTSFCYVKCYGIVIFKMLQNLKYFRRFHTIHCVI